MAQKHTSRHNYKVGQNGEIHIRKELMEALGIGPDWIVLQRVVDDKLEVEFMPPEHNESLLGILSDFKGPGIPADADWSKIREDTWAWAVENDF